MGITGRCIHKNQTNENFRVLSLIIPKGKFNKNAPLDIKKRVNDSIFYITIRYAIYISQAIS